MTPFEDMATALDPARLFTMAGLTPDPWQAELLRGRPKRALMLCTRQAGKSTTTAAVALWEAVYSPPALVLLLSPSLRQSQELFRKVMQFYRATGETVPVQEASALRLELANGSRIIALPGSEETIRGYSGVRLLVVDEAARVADSLYYSIRPMLAVSGGRMICLSTPFGKRGFFFDAWTAAEDWQKIKVTATDCARISPEFLAQERAALGDWWYGQEYECQFMDTVDCVFRHQEVMGALSDQVKPLFEAITEGNSFIHNAIDSNIQPITA